jgi:hypothetical protein
VKSDTTERGLERLICTALTGRPCDPGGPGLDQRNHMPSRFPVAKPTAAVAGLLEGR